MSSACQRLSAKTAGFCSPIPIINFADAGAARASMSAIVSSAVRVIS